MKKISHFSRDFLLQKLTCFSLDKALHKKVLSLLQGKKRAKINPFLNCFSKRTNIHYLMCGLYTVRFKIWWLRQTDWFCAKKCKMQIAKNVLWCADYIHLIAKSTDCLRPIGFVQKSTRMSPLTNEKNWKWTPSNHKNGIKKAGRLHAPLSGNTFDCSISAV